MTVGILIISHDDVGATLLQTASSTLGFCPLQSRVVSVSRNCTPESRTDLAMQFLHDVDSNDGVLVLTDMYGSTPSNIACALLDYPRIRVVSGLNLPMLIRVLNYPRLSLDELAEKALSGGREGIVDCSRQSGTNIL